MSRYSAAERAALESRRVERVYAVLARIYDGFFDWALGPGRGLAVQSPPIRPGDRIAFVGNTFADQLWMHGYLETLLLQRSAGNPVSIRNLGWAGDMLTARDRPTNFATEESTLTAHKTDVIIACFGMGESFAGESGVERFKQDLQNFIASPKGKKYNGKTEVRLILISTIAYKGSVDSICQSPARPYPAPSKTWFHNNRPAIDQCRRRITSGHLFVEFLSTLVASDCLLTWDISVYHW